MNYVLNFTLWSLKAKWSVMKSHFSTAPSVREPCISMRVYGSQQTTNWFWNWFKKCMYPHQVNIRASIKQWSWSSVTITGQACREQWISTFRIAMSASSQSLQRIKRMNCSILFQSLNSVKLISRWISSQDYLQQRMKRMQYSMSWTVYQKNIITITCTSDNNDTMTEETLKILIHWVYWLHSMPAFIVSDRGPQFVSTMWKSFCKHMEIQVNLLTAFYPEKDSQTEQVNQNVETFLQAYTNKNQNNWDTWLPITEFADNNINSAAITLSPFFMNHGFHLWMSFEPDLTLYEVTRQCLQAWSAGELTVKMNEILSFTKQHLAETQKAMLRQTNKHWKNVNYEVRDMIFLNSRNIKTQQPLKKLNNKMFESFKIVIKVERAFQLKLPRTMLIHNIFHASLLQKAVTDPLLRQKQTLSLLIVMNDQEEWEVNEIQNSRHFEHEKWLQYQVKWHN